MEDQNPWSLFIHFLWTWVCAFHSIIYRYLFSWWSDTKKFSILWGLLSLINLSIHYSKFLSRGYNFTSTVISIMKSRLQMSFHTIQNQYNLLIKKKESIQFSTYMRKKRVQSTVGFIHNLPIQSLDSSAWEDLSRALFLLDPIQLIFCSHCFFFVIVWSSMGSFMVIYTWCRNPSNLSNIYDMRIYMWRQFNCMIESLNIVRLELEYIRSLYSTFFYTCVCLYVCARAPN